MNLPKIDFSPYRGWDDEVGSCFIRETNDIAQTQNQSAEETSRSFSSAERLLNNGVSYKSLRMNIDALRPPV